MTIKNLFQTEKILSSTNLQEIDVESPGFISKALEEKDKFIPYIDYSKPENFAFFGLAEQYYEDSINYILDSYPYDGSGKEKLEWQLSASYLDKYIFDKEFPRTSGFINLGKNYGNIVSSSSGYSLYGSPNYIFFKGGPNTSSIAMVGQPLYQTFNKSNYYDPNLKRESNLEINGNQGITLEFWFKKNSYSSGNESQKQVIFDIWNSASYGRNSYGRFKVEIQPEQQNKFYIELQSGSSGLTNGIPISIGNNLNISGSNWNQYSLSIINSGSNMVASLYLAGTLNDTVITGSSIGLVTGSMIGTIGSLVAPISGNFGQLGFGKLSGSIDELRFWKIKKTSKQIGQNWFTQVNAGSNTDEPNTNLGLYYKFNEGIMDTGSIHPLDAKVIDYSGRNSNGAWIGYVTGSRDTGSALESNSDYSEFKDPILYPIHPQVSALSVAKQEIGFAHDTSNNACIFKTIPEWITKEDESKGQGELRKLTQTMASFLDTVYLQIDSLSKLKAANYISGSLKPIPFVSRLLNSMGVDTPELFSEAEAMELLAARDNYREYSEKLSDVKNRIYQNIYNNLPYIFKSKGTEKSFKNMIRCFGVDDELIKLNLYTDNDTYEFKENFKFSSVPKKYADFNNVDRFYATVYQHTSSAPSSRSYISAPNNIVYHGNTFQVETIFPKKFQKDSQLYFSTPFLISSVFGCHTAECSEQTDKTWSNPDLANFQVYAVRPSEESKNVYFLLSGSAGSVIPILTSSIFNDVYDNQKWNLNVRIKPLSYPFADGVSGSTQNSFTIEFNGYNTVMDFVNNSFSLSGTIPSSDGFAFMTTSKRFFVGAHRQNFTGSILQYSDVKISSLRVWESYLSDEEIILHSKDASNYGVKQPYANAWMTELSRSFGQ